MATATTCTTCGKPACFIGPDLRHYCPACMVMAALKDQGKAGQFSFAAAEQQSPHTVTTGRP